MTIKKLLIFSGVILGIVAVIFIVSLVSVSKSTHMMEDTQLKRSMSLLLADELRESSRDLTSAVQKFVVTGDERYAAEYSDVLLIRSGEKPRPDDSEIAPGQLISMSELMKLAEYTELELSLLKLSFDLSDNLVHLETEAMNLARGAFSEREKAMALIFNPDYEVEVARIMEPFSLFKQELDTRLNADMAIAQAEHSRSFNFLWVAFSIVITMFIAFLLLVAMVIVRPVLICDRFARQIADGHLSSPLDYTSGNEIGSLAKSLRFMLKSLIERFELQENMRYYSAIISSVDAGVIIKDEAGVVQEWNIGAENILGYKAEEIIGHTTKYYAPKEEHAGIEEKDKQLSQGEHIAHADVVRKHKDGRLIDCSASYTPIFNAAGIFIGSIAIFHDVTEKKLAEQRARRLAAIIAIADAGIIIKDMNGVVQEWNIGAENILGYKAEEIIGHTTKYYAPKAGHAGIDEIDNRLKKGEHTAHVEVVRKHKDGRLIDCSASYTPIFDDNSNFIGSVAIFHDVTSEKLAEKKAKKLAAIVSVADSGIIVKDEDCNIIDWNIGAENILGYTPEEIIGKNTKYYVPDEYHSEVDDIKLRLLRGEHTTHVEVIRKHKDGRLIDCSASFTPVFDQNGRFTGSVTVFQDICDKKQIECALKEALRTAEEASKAKSIFLANMSHEMRTPMNGVIGFAELALYEDGVSANIKDYLSKIKTSADSLLHIINDILDISKIEAGAMKLEKIPFELHNIFKECEAVSNLKAAEKGIILHFYEEPIVGKMLVGDPTKLRQVLINLLSNAIKFTHSGMVKLTAITEEVEDDKVKIRIEVTDSGIGMTEEQLKSVFDPFIQADSSTTRKYGGTGLGLSITKSFIELMDGKLEVESTPEIGSKFVFTLPFETILKSEDEILKDTYSAGAAKPVFMGNVLVCEDNSINQEVIAKHLSQVGLTSVIASNGKQGLDAVEESMQSGNLFDLILMDIHMPVMDGLVAMQKLIESGNKVPVVAMTANAMSTDKKKYLEHGMSDYLSKPFTAQELWACLIRHLTPVNFTQVSGTVNPESEPLNSEDLIISNVLNEKAGLENSLGDVSFFRHIQKNFYKNNLNIDQQLKNAIQQGNLKSAHRIAHTLKSSAGLIGAEKLAKAAGSVELAFSGENTGCTPGQMEALESALREVLTILEPLSTANEPKPEQTMKILDKELAKSLIEQITPLLKCGDPESVEYVDKIRTILSPLGDVSENLAGQIEDYDFDIAYETILGIKVQ